MPKPKIIRIDSTITAVGVLKMLEDANIIVRLFSGSGQHSYIAARGISRAAIRKFIKADEKQDENMESNA